MLRTVWFLETINKFIEKGDVCSYITLSYIFDTSGNIITYP